LLDGFVFDAPHGPLHGTLFRPVGLAEDQKHADEARHKSTPLLPERASPKRPPPLSPRVQPAPRQRAERGVWVKKRDPGDGPTVPAHSDRPGPLDRALPVWLPRPSPETDLQGTVPVALGSPAVSSVSLV